MQEVKNGKGGRKEGVPACSGEEVGGSLVRDSIMTSPSTVPPPPPPPGTGGGETGANTIYLSLFLFLLTAEEELVPSEKLPERGGCVYCVGSLSLSRIRVVFYIYIIYISLAPPLLWGIILLARDRYSTMDTGSG